MSINWTLMQTVEDKAALAAEAHAAAVKAECGRRITAVAAEYTQINLTGAATAGVLDEAEMEAYRQSVAWVAATRAACAWLIEHPEADHQADEHWPVCPDDVAALAAAF